MLAIIHNDENVIDIEVSECSSEDDDEIQGMKIHHCSKKESSELKEK